MYDLHFGCDMGLSVLGKPFSQVRRSGKKIRFMRGKLGSHVDEKKVNTVIGLFELRDVITFLCDKYVVRQDPDGDVRASEFNKQDKRPEK